MVLKVLLALVTMYVAVLVMMFAFQTWLLFPAGAVSPPPPLPASAERLMVAVPSGHRLSGVHIPASAPGSARLLILGFGGNAWNADAAALYLHDLYPEADVAAFHYRGYAPSEGRASAAALLADAPHVHDLMQRRAPDARIVAVGFSIGSGVAAALAAHRPLDGVVLVTPFASLAAVASGHYPWLPVRWLLRHRMEPAAALETVQTPVALVAGERDTLIPAAHAEALRRRLPNPVYFHVVAGAGHNDIYGRRAFRQAMREALGAVLAQRTPGASAGDIPAQVR